MTDAFFRAGAGAMLLDKSDKILVLRRKGFVDRAWQLPQGGIKAIETPIAACYRELMEEASIQQDQIKPLAQASQWMAYELPPEYRNSKVGWGQVQMWFLFRFLAPHSAVRPDHVEFEEADWVDAESLMARTVEFRVPTYHRLIQEFAGYFETKH